MARTVTLDGLDLIEVRLLQSRDGAIFTYASYVLKAGSQPIEHVMLEEITRDVAASQATITGLWQAATQAIQARQLS